MDYGTGKLPLPTALRLGATYRHVFDGSNSLSFTTELAKATYIGPALSGEGLSLHNGTEWQLGRSLALRAGHVLPHAQAHTKSHWTFGAGMALSGIMLDFSYALSHHSDRPLPYRFAYGLSLHW